MIVTVLLLSILPVAFSQYPHQRAPAPQGPPPQRQAEPPQQAYRPPPRASDVFRPASVHYVNIGAELAGDYKFGYDTGRGNDGQSFREETRLPDGSVQGAYGYVDETGQQRIVKYTAGKEGFKVQGDSGSEGGSRSSGQAQAAPQQQRYQPPQQEYQPPQQSYQPPPQVHRAPPAAAYAPPPQPEYRAPPQQQSYDPEPQAYAPPRARQQSYAPRRQYDSQPARRTYDNEPDYDDPNNDLTERRLAPIDTSLLNYNIGASQDRGH